MSTPDIELKDGPLRCLESICPRQPRQRSELILRAIRNARWEIEESNTAAAYARQPDTAEEAYFDPETWEQ